MPLFGSPNIDGLKVKGDIQGLVKASLHRDAQVRQAAVEALVKIGAPAVEPLIAALQHRDNAIRITSAKVLGQIGDGRAVKALTAALEDKNVDVRQAVTEALAKVGTPAVESLITALQHKDNAVRTASARVLGQIGDERAVEALIACFQTGPDETFGSHSDRRAAVVQALAEIGAPAIQPLMAALKEGKVDSSDAAKVLIQIGGQQAVEPLIIIYESICNSERPFGIEEVAIALGELGDSRAVEPLINGLEKDDSVGSVLALQKLGGARAASVLQEYYRGVVFRIELATEKSLSTVRIGFNAARAALYMHMGERIAEMSGRSKEILLGCASINKPQLPGQIDDSVIAACVKVCQEKGLPFEQGRDKIVYQPIGNVVTGDFAEATAGVVLYP